MDTGKYYEELKKKGAHKFIWNSFGFLARLKEIFWIISVLIFGFILFRAEIITRLSRLEKVFLLFGLVGLFKLGGAWGHKQGFLSGYDKGVEDAGGVTKSKSLSRVQKEELRKYSNL